MSAVRGSATAGSAAQAGELSGRALHIVAALVIALVAGALLIATASTLSATFRVLSAHYPFAAAWMAFWLRFLRSEPLWVEACDLACLALCIAAMLVATVR